MNKQQAEGLLQALGSKASSHSGTWVRGKCPLAPWRHPSGKDSHPSFGLYVADGEPGRFHCFTCESGSLATLLQTLEFMVSKSPDKFHGDLKKAREIVDSEEIDIPVLPEYSEYGHHSNHKQFQPLPDYFLDSFLPVENYSRAMEYLSLREVTLKESRDLDLRYDAQEDRIVFPYRDVFGRLAGLRGRGVELGGESHWSKHHDYVWNGINNSSLVWYGEELLDSPGPIVVVEGQFDRIRARRVYPRVMGNLTAKPVLEKITKLAQADGVILMLDGDQPGRDATKKFAEVLDFLRVPVATIFLPMQDDAGKAIKTDPDSLGEEWIRTQFKNIGLVD